MIGISKHNFRIKKIFTDDDNPKALIELVCEDVTQAEAIIDELISNQEKVLRMETALRMFINKTNQ